MHFMNEDMSSVPVTDEVPSTKAHSHSAARTSAQLTQSEQDLVKRHSHQLERRTPPQGLPDLITPSRGSSLNSASPRTSSAELDHNKEVVSMQPPALALPSPPRPVGNMHLPSDSCEDRLVVGHAQMNRSAKSLPFMLDDSSTDLSCVLASPRHPLSPSPLCRSRSRTLSLHDPEKHAGANESQAPLPRARNSEKSRHSGNTEASSLLASMSQPNSPIAEHRPSEEHISMPPPSRSGMSAPARYPGSPLGGFPPTAWVRPRKYCGMPFCVFASVLVMALLIVTAIVMVPVSVKLLHKDIEVTRSKASAEGRCKDSLSCQNDGVYTFSDNGTCACSCLYPYFGETCEEQLSEQEADPDKCKTIQTAGKSQPIGADVVRLAGVAQSFGQKVDLDSLFNQFNKSATGCTEQNDLLKSGNPKPGLKRQKRTLTQFEAAVDQWLALQGQQNPPPVVSYDVEPTVQIVTLRDYLKAVAQRVSRFFDVFPELRSFINSVSPVKLPQTPGSAPDFTNGLVPVRGQTPDTPQTPGQANIPGTNQPAQVPTNNPASAPGVTNDGQVPGTSSPAGSPQSPGTGVRPGFDQPAQAKPNNPPNTPIIGTLGSDQPKPKNSGSGKPPSTPKDPPKPKSQDDDDFDDVNNAKEDTAKKSKPTWVPVVPVPGPTVPLRPSPSSGFFPSQSENPTSKRENDPEPNDTGEEGADGGDRGANEPDGQIGGKDGGDPQSSPVPESTAPTLPAASTPIIFPAGLPKSASDGGSPYATPLAKDGSQGVAKARQQAPTETPVAGPSGNAALPAPPPNEAAAPRSSAQAAPVGKNEQTPTIKPKRNGKPAEKVKPTTLPQSTSPQDRRKVFQQLIVLQVTAKRGVAAGQAIKQEIDAREAQDAFQGRFELVGDGFRVEVDADKERFEII